MISRKKGLWTIIALILTTGGVLAYLESLAAPEPSAAVFAGARSDGLLSLSAALAQSKVLVDSDGRFSVSLDLKAAVLDQNDDQSAAPVDLVLVLDRSGSMNGSKIRDAKAALLHLSRCLTARDRLALVTYSYDARIETGLLPMDAAGCQRLAAVLERVRAEGGTNLGGGLQLGMNLLSDSPVTGRNRKLILISDGLANQGITAPDELGAMTTAATEFNFSVSSVGVGYDFNEMLMTMLADRGGGRYYYLEKPQAFAQVFEEEFQTARRVAVTGLQLRIPVRNGLQLLHAGGYPITYLEQCAIFYPGDLLSGQQRRLYLTFAVPADRSGEIAIDDIQVRYQDRGVEKILDARLGLTVACVADPAQVAASVDEKIWSGLVLQEEYGRLKDQVAEAIRKGERENAIQQIQSYETQTRQMNADVGSAAVRQNIDRDVRQLREMVSETFAGAPSAVEVKRRQQAKSLQYDSYQVRRDNKGQQP